MTADELMRLVNRYTEACDDLGSGLFEQSEAETNQKHAKAKDLHTQILQMFERFAIGIPVFHGGEPFGIIARLKYRLNSGKVSFHYELTRPDRSHQHAAMDLIKVVRDGLGGVPLLMGGIEG